MSGDAAKQAHSRASLLIDERRFEEAVEPAGQACTLQPAWTDAWWNYGIALKHAHRWADCLEACDRAIALDPSNSGGAHWNAGIAATALGDWKRARQAWTAYGMDIPPGEGPLEMKLGHAGVRVTVDEHTEVLYGVRLDPCRVRLVSVPMPESEHRFGDVVLHDGEARGTRGSGTHKITVFDELQVLETSTYGTWTVTATCPTPEKRDALIDLFDGVDGAVEDWTASLHQICAQCSKGEPHAHHGEPASSSWHSHRTLALALRHEAELKRLRRLGLWWRGGVTDVARVL